MEQHEKIYRSKKRIAVDNFIGGIMWALGVFIGGTIVVAIITLVLKRVDLIPVIGTFVSKIIVYVQSSSQLVK